MVIGGTGDLTFRKLLPALYYNHRRGLIDACSRIIAAARSRMSTEEYHARVAQALSEHLPPEDIDATDLNAFLQKVSYTPIDATEDDGWDALRSVLDANHNPVRVFYLATAPHLFGPICHHLRAAGLINDRSRVVLEKPLGHDITSALAINRDVGSVFSERNIFRIDHYLGKESVQNLLPSVLPMFCSSHFGTVALLTTFKSLLLKLSGWKGGAATTNMPAPCGIWFKTIFYRFCAWWPWIPLLRWGMSRFGMKSSKFSGHWER